MHYCERCKLLNKDAICEKCGKSHLPQVQPDDICFVVKLWLNYAEMYEEALKSKNIPVFLVPCGFSVRMRSSDDRNIYVPYEFYNEAIDVYKCIFSRKNDESDETENSEQDGAFDGETTDDDAMTEDYNAVTDDGDEN